MRRRRAARATRPVVAARSSDRPRQRLEGHSTATHHRSVRRNAPHLPHVRRRARSRTGPWAGRLRHPLTTGNTADVTDVTDVTNVTRDAVVARMTALRAPDSGGDGPAHGSSSHWPASRARTGDALTLTFWPCGCCHHHTLRRSHVLYRVARQRREQGYSITLAVMAWFILLGTL